MNILDENVPKNQRELLRSWRIPIRQIGYNVGRRGMTDDEAAIFVRRVLRHRSFNTQAKRMGAMMRVSSTGIAVWRLHTEKETRLGWTD